jgi:protein gp37
VNRTSIEWCDYTSNPLRYRTDDGRIVWACEKVSPGCARCYASALSERYDRRAGDWNAATMATLTPFLDEKELGQMLTAKRIGKHDVTGSKCFLGDMTDIFGEWVPDELLDELFHVMRVRADVTWQVLTKRADRLRRYWSEPIRPSRIDDGGMRLLNRGIGTSFICLDQRGRVDSHEWPMPNVWIGVSAEDQLRADERIPLLLQTPAAIRFVSAEPLLGPIDLRIDDEAHHLWDGRYESTSAKILKAQERKAGLHWVIVGGESGAGARRCYVPWVRSIVQQCRAANVPIFVKQLGAEVITRNDDGFQGEFNAENPTEWPEHLAVEDRVEDHPNGFREDYQGADVRLHLRKHKGSDMDEWPLDLRVREFPRTAVPT